MVCLLLPSSSLSGTKPVSDKLSPDHTRQLLDTIFIYQNLHILIKAHYSHSWGNGQKIYLCDKTLKQYRMADSNLRPFHNQKCRKLHIVCQGSKLMRHCHLRKDLFSFLLMLAIHNYKLIWLQFHFWQVYIKSFKTTISSSPSSSAFYAYISLNELLLSFCHLIHTTLWTAFKKYFCLVLNCTSFWTEVYIYKKNVL